MCGRFTLTATPEDVRALFAYMEHPNFPPRYNIAPTQPIASVRFEHGQRRFALLRWGLIPSWVKDPASFTLLINARSETAAEKPSFRAAMRHHRCLVPASGFYEWHRTAEGKQPYWVRPRGGGLMAMAGLWETWSDPNGGDMDTGALLTMDSNAFMQQIHHRMPVVIQPEDFSSWLDNGGTSVKEAKELIRPVAEDYFEAIPVSTRVNSVRNDDVELLAAVNPGGKDEVVQTGPKKVSGKKAAGHDQLDLF